MTKIIALSQGKAALVDDGDAASKYYGKFANLNNLSADQEVIKERIING